MHLSRFEFNTARRGARDLLSSPHRLHGAVSKAFPHASREPTAAGRILWRLDERHHQALLYIVSPHVPDLTHIVEVAGWPTTNTWDTRPYSPLLGRLAAGGHWAFRLTANPTRNRRTDDDARSQRFAHITVAQQTDWLIERSARNGFRLVTGFGNQPDVAVHRRRTWRFTRDGATVTLAMATFEGTLEIIDPTAFRHSLTHGIGPAKGYGCGLLTLARPI
jgi:CRISPR system Cascade subunit CasE